MDKYIDHPEAFPDEVWYFNADVVIIQDKFPKSFAHYLVLPRDDTISWLHPYQALSDPQIVAFLAPYVDKTVAHVQRELGLADRSRVRTGCHAVPSERRLHVHVISDDLLGSGMETVHRYMVFATEFFVKFGEPPAHANITDELKRQLSENSYKDTPRCIHCGKVLDSGYDDLRAHLEYEYKKLQS